MQFRPTKHRKRHTRHIHACITLRHIALRCIAWRYIASHITFTFTCAFKIACTCTIHLITSQRVTSHYATWTFTLALACAYAFAVYKCHYIYIDICIHLHVNLPVHLLYICICMCICICIYITCTLTCACACTFTCAFTFTRACTCTSAFAFTVHDIELHYISLLQRAPHIHCMSLHFHYNALR